MTGRTGLASEEKTEILSLAVSKLEAGILSELRRYPIFHVGFITEQIATFRALHCFLTFELSTSIKCPVFLVFIFAERNVLILC